MSTVAAKKVRAKDAIDAVEKRFGKLTSATAAELEAERPERKTRDLFRHRAEKLMDSFSTMIFGDPLVVAPVLRAILQKALMKNYDDGIEDAAANMRAKAKLSSFRNALEAAAEAALQMKVEGDGD